MESSGWIRLKSPPQLLTHHHSAQSTVLPVVISCQRSRAEKERSQGNRDQRCVAGVTLAGGGG